MELLIPPACLILCRQYGIRESKEVTIEGRVQFDLLQVGLGISILYHLQCLGFFEWVLSMDYCQDNNQHEDVHVGNAKGLQA